MFNYISLVLIITMTISSAFNPVRLIGKSVISPCRMVDENVELVPVEKTTIASAAAVTGGILGLILGGPYGALVGAAMTNYVVKKDNESGEAFRGLGKTIIGTFWKYIPLVLAI